MSLNINPVFFITSMQTEVETIPAGERLTLSYKSKTEYTVVDPEHLPSDRFTFSVVDKELNHKFYVTTKSWWVLKPRTILRHDGYHYTLSEEVKCNFESGSVIIPSDDSEGVLAVVNDQNWALKQPNCLTFIQHEIGGTAKIPFYLNHCGNEISVFI